MLMSLPSVGSYNHAVKVQNSAGRIEDTFPDPELVPVLRLRVCSAKRRSKVDTAGISGDLGFTIITEVRAFLQAEVTPQQYGRIVVGGEIFSITQVYGPSARGAAPHHYEFEVTKVQS